MSPAIQDGGVVTGGGGIVAIVLGGVVTGARSNVRFFTKLIFALFQLPSKLIYRPIIILCAVLTENAIVQIYDNCN